VTGRSPVAHRPRRADGQRNYDAILTAATAEFTAHGSQASLGEIASQAGVAIGTLYRHFPTRATLIEAATRDGLTSLLDYADKVSAAGDPVDALTAWMSRAVDYFSTFRGLAQTLTESRNGDNALSETACAELTRCGVRMLEAAQATGRIRADLTAEELFDLLGAAAWVRETSQPGHDGSVRLLAVMIAGIRS
jgi:AcrR family transcriptional regulator